MHRVTINAVAIAPALVCALLVCAAPAAAQSAQGARQAATQTAPKIPPPPPPPKPPNVLLIIADEVGVDNVACYGEHPDAAHTPVIDDLAQRGVLFRNAWVYPTCSPTRAAILTGRHAFRTGVGRVIDYLVFNFELGIEEPTIAKALAPTPYHRLAVGKWHLATKTISGLAHPFFEGFEHFLGPMSNLDDLRPGNCGSYYSFLKSYDGEQMNTTVYATTDQVNDALQLIAGCGDEPWFMWLAFNAAHSPIEKPPPELHTYPLPESVEDDIVMHFKAMIEAMDTEIGRLFTEMDPEVLQNTIVIFIGDNGTPGLETTPPFDPNHAKNSLFEGGVNVPLIVAGPGVVEGFECAGLVQGTDIYATVCEIAGADGSDGLDSVSLMPYFQDPGMPSIRSWVYSQSFSPDGFLPVYFVDRRAARNERYKLIQSLMIDGAAPAHPTQFYDLLLDPFETTDLTLGKLTPEEQANLDQLAADMQALQPW